MSDLTTLILISLLLQTASGPSPTPFPTHTLTAAPSTATATPSASATASPTTTPSLTSSPTLTASASPTDMTSPTPSASATPSPTSITPAVTPTITPTATASSTPTVTVTPQIVTQVITVPPVVIVLTQPAPATPPPLPTAPPEPTQPPVPTPASRGQPAPAPSEAPYGWRRTQSEDLIRVTGNWAVRRDARADAGAYSDSASGGAALSFPFEGDGLRIRYQVHPQGGVFEVVLDGESLGVVHTISQETGYRTAGPWFINGGYHLLELRAIETQSGVSVVGVDYIDVYQGPPRPNSDEDRAERPVVAFELIDGPATVPPTATPQPASVLDVEVVVAYDRNASGAVDLDEGVQGVSISAVDPANNTALQTAITDERGSARLRLLAESDVVVTIPQLGRERNLRPRPGTTVSETWVVLLPAGSQPSLLP